MDDYSSYLSALQASDLVQQKQEQQQQNELIPAEEKASIPGMAVGSVLGMGPLLKNAGVNIAKQVLKNKLKDAGISDDSIETILKGDLTDVSSKAKDILAAAKSTIESKVDAAKQAASDIVDSAKQTASDAMDTAKTTISDTVDSAQQVASDSLNTTSALASDTLDNAQGMFNSGVNFFGDDLPSFFSSGLDSARSMLQTKMGNNIDFANPVDTEFGGELLQEPKMLQQFGGFSPLASQGDVGLSEAEQSADGILSRITSFFPSELNQLSLQDTIGQTLSDTMNQVQNIMPSSLQQAMNVVNDAVAPASTTSNIAGATVESASGAVSDAVGAVSDAVGATIEGATEAATTAAASTAEVVGGVAAGIGGMAADALGPLGMLAGVLGSLFGEMDSEKILQPPPMLLNPSTQFL